PYIRLGSPTTTSCPSTSNSRDTHGECVPASRTTRHRSRPPKYSRSPARVVTTRPRPTSRPRQSTSHTSLTLSPRSSPTVILGNSSVPPRIADLRLRDPRVRQRSTSLASGILRYAATGRRSAFSSQLRGSGSRGGAEGHVEARRGAHTETRRRGGMEIDDITAEIVDAAVKLHVRLGPGLLESVYEAVLARELARRGLSVQRRKPIGFEFDGVWFEEGLRVDLL